MIKGFVGTSLIDFPGILSCVIFCGGCNFRCPFCQNVDLVLPERLKVAKDLENSEVLSFIVKRKKFIDGVVITGGEPTIHQELFSFLKELKESVPSIKIKLDTNGSNPSILFDLITDKLIDYIAVDIKSSPKKHDYATGILNSFQNVSDTIKLLLSNNYVDYEFRTTFVPKIVEKEDIFEIADYIKDCKRYAIQQFRNKETLDQSFRNVEPYPSLYIEEIAESLRSNYKFDVITRIY